MNKTTSLAQSTSNLVMLGLLTAVLLIMSYTPLGYLNIGPLAITLNVIPVAIACIALGPTGGAIIGAAFGITSFLQCIGIGGTSGMGAICFELNPFFAFIQRFLPRMLDGLLVGHIFKFSSKIVKKPLACAIAGFAAAFFNTLFFMSALVILYGNTEYIQGLIGGRNIIVFICSFVGINAVFEMLASTVVTSAIGAALYKAKLLYTPNGGKNGTRY